ncbi:YARHG domain-containing protein [Paenibacillus jilunlii]|uniref:YARHG domain-containing protein n=1 Tax=Paenibacillus jilunlii TaxID=682956 RepID=A0A1G9KGU5_9BACL|nr:YARHG domain-containing protein [Paenibacillus jilunlii]KWX69939.1 hypothetical protein AML91_29750 [Paenibacillus jilunlii]SDL48767.1 YARHG domain-containing protein [Paenibacillus jilunlii]
MNNRKYQLFCLLAAGMLQIAGCETRPAAQPDQVPQIQAEKSNQGKASAENRGTGREYIFQDSDKTLLTEENLSNIDSRMLELARNEIFARHGLVFKRPDLKDYFAGKRWYTPDEDYNGSLSDTESRNIKLIQKHEKLMSANQLEKLWDVDDHVLGYPQGDESIRLPAANVDLNGDGTVEHIQMTLTQHYEVTDEWSLSVNDSKLKIELSDSYSTSYFKIVDSNINDPYFEIALEDSNESAQFTTDYYYYNGHDLIHMGTLDGLTANAQSLDGHGTVTTSRQAIDLQCWFYLETFKLDGEHMWKESPADFYPMEPPTPWVAKVRFPIYTTSGQDDILKWVEPGDSVYFQGGDTEGKGKIKTEDGTTGWIQVKDGHLSGTDTDIYDCFEGLLLYG